MHIVCSEEIVMAQATTGGANAHTKPSIIKTKGEASQAARRAASLLVRMQREAAKRDTRMKKIESESNARIEEAKNEIFAIGEQLFKYWKRNQKQLEAESKSQTIPIAAAIIKWYRTKEAVVLSSTEEEVIREIEERLPNHDTYVTVTKKLNRNGLISARRKLSRLKIPGLGFESGKVFSLAPKNGLYTAVRDIASGTWRISIPRSKK